MRQMFFKILFYLQMVDNMRWAAQGVHSAEHNPKG